MTNTLLAGWTKYNTNISEEAIQVFDKVMERIVGVQYTPLAYSKQEVNGTNYSYFCNMKAVYPDSPNEAAMVSIYKPINGEPHLREIQPIVHNFPNK
jgi:hypothetical protein